MQIIKLLEMLATNTHFQHEVHELVAMQSREINEALLKNDTMPLKAMFPENEITADRTTIFQI